MHPFDDIIYVMKISLQCIEIRVVYLHYDSLKNPIPSLVLQEQGWTKEEMTMLGSECRTCGIR